MSRRTWLLFVLLAVVWGLPYLLIKVAVREVDPVVVVFGRCAIGAAVLLPLALRRGGIAPLRAHWRTVVVFTMVEVAGPWLLIGHAEQRLTSSTAGLLVAVTPLLAALLLTRLGDDRIDVRRGLGLGVGLVGVGCFVGLDLRLGDVVATAAMLVAALGYAIGPIVIARRLTGVSPLAVISVALLLTSLVYAPFVPMAAPSGPVSAEALWSVVALGLVCTAAAFVAFFALVADVGPARATVITYLNPAVAVTLGVVMLDEPVTFGMVVGFPLVVLGSILSTARSRAPVTTRRPTAPAVLVPVLKET